MKIKLIDFGYKQAPNRAHENDAGADVYVMDCVTLPPNSTTRVPLGFGLELPDGYAAFVFPRSGFASGGVTCELPPIDSGYRGEIHAIVTNINPNEVVLRPDQRIGQIVITPVILADFIDYDIKERGTGAFASTGV
jgi:dUTP pyrophosphatase